jgi:MFS family permease
MPDHDFGQWKESNLLHPLRRIPMMGMLMRSGGSPSMNTNQASAPTSTTANGASAAAHHPTPALSTAMIIAMAAAAGAAVANIYYNQPMLEVMSRDMHGNHAIDQVSMVTQLGYAAGLVLLVPLGDFINRKRLIVMQFLVVALAAVWLAISGGPSGLLMASLVIGLCSTVAQQIIPFAVHLAPPEKRGHVLGMVMAGLLCGILLSRTLAGFVATHAGWREMFWLCVPLGLRAPP